MISLKKQFEDKYKISLQAPTSSGVSLGASNVAPAKTISLQQSRPAPAVTQSAPAMSLRQPQAKPRNIGVKLNSLPKQQVALREMEMTPERIREKKMYAGFKEGKSLEDIAKLSGNSMKEVQSFKDSMFPTYGDKGLLMNVANGIGGFVGNMVKEGAGIVTRPFNDIADLDRKKGEATLQDINAQYQDGSISPEAAMERAQTLARKYTTQKAYQDKDGWIRVGTQNPVEFAGNVAQQGIDTSSLLPAGSGASQGVSNVIKMTAPNSSKLLNFAGKLDDVARFANPYKGTVTGQGTAGVLRNMGMGDKAADIVGSALSTNARQSAVTGTLQTGTDILSGRGITPESVAMNYGADFALGAGMELGLSGVGAGIRRGIDMTPTNRTNAHPAVQELKLKGDELLAQRQSLLDRGVSPHHSSIAQINKAIQSVGIEYNQTYKKVLNESKMKLQRGSIDRRLVGDFSSSQNKNVRRLSDIANQYGHENSSRQILDEAVDMAYSYDKTAKGGQPIDTRDATGAFNVDEGMKRISEHSDFYRDYYKTNKRAPSKAAFREEIDRQLANGGGSLVDPDMLDAYHVALAREADAPLPVNTTDYSLAFENDLMKAGIAPSSPRTTNGRKNMTARQNPANQVDQMPNRARLLQENLQQSQQASRVTSPQKLPKQTSETLSSSPKIDQKSPVVNEARRAISGNKSTYGLKDSFEASPNVPQELKEALGAFGDTRTVRSNKDLWQTAQQRVAQDPAEAMGFFRKNNSDESVAVGYALINRYMKSGNSREAGNIAMDMAERALEAGRTTQAYALMKRLTPEGSVAYVEKKVQRFISRNPNLEKKVKWNDAVRTKLYTIADELNKLPEGRERNLMIGKMQQEIDNIFPSSITDKAVTVWKAGLLTSLRTHERNLVGNAINVASEQLSTAPGSFADMLMGLRTGKRTLVTSHGEGLFKGAKVGAQIAKDQIKTGIDVTNSNLKYNINHITWGDNKVEKFFKGYTEGVFRPLGAEDKLFKEAARANSIYNQVYAEAYTKNLKGQAFDDYTAKRVKNPTSKMLDIAEQDAGRATFSHDNHLGEIIKNAKAVVRRSNKPGAKAASAALDILMPFTQVPSGVASQLYAYSPAKLIKSVYDIGKVMITGDSTLQRQVAQGFGRSAVGTAILGAGALLYSKGLMLGEPRDDAEKAQWEAEGKKPNSIKVGDRWYQISSIGPQAILALAGGQYVADMENGQNANMNIAANLGNSFKDQTFLKGMSSALDAIDDPSRYMESYVEGQAASVIPNLVKDLAKAFDPESRQANGWKDRFKSSIPGLSNTLPQRYDAYGQPIHSNGALALVDMFNSTQEKKVPEVRYAEWLRNNTGLKEHIPTKVDRSIKINGETMRLNAQQQSDYQKYIGERSKSVIANFSRDPSFVNLSDEEKVKKIDNSLEDINAAAKIELFGNRPKNVSNSVKEALDGNAPSWSLGSEASYKDKYQKAQQDFEKNSGSWSPVERAKKQRNLQYLAVQKDFENDTVSLYNMSKDDAYDLVTNDPNGQDYVDKILAYGDALVKAGLTKTNKFRDKYGNIKISSATSSGTSGKSSGRSKSSGTSKSAKGKFDYKLFGFSSGGKSNSSDLYALLKKAKIKRGIA